MLTRMTASIAAFTALALAAPVAHAIELKGSDTLELMTQQVLANCPGTSTITYIGGGSSAGEQALLVGTQEIAPMSRFLANQRTCQFSTPQTAQGYAHSLDGLAIVRDENSIVACDGVAFTGSIAVTDQNNVSGLQCPGCTDGSYALADWRDVLRLIYAGVHHDGSKDCASDVRYSLVNDWDNFFEGECASETCVNLRHAWRRADLSGTTDTFLSLLNLPAITTTPFCNGKDLEDKDPIRRTCVGNEEVCNSSKSLGLVLPVFVPEALDTGLVYNANTCSTGVFTFELAPFGELKCPNTTSTLFGKCLTPRDAAGHAGCLNKSFNVPAFSPSGADGRAYNLVLRNADGTIAVDASNRQLKGSFYRIHTTKTVSTPADTCTKQSATLQIGCLVQADACTIGFAGREAADLIPDATSLRVNGILPTNANVRLLLTDPTNPGVYPLARLLYLNTMKGFASLTDPAQAALAACFQNRTVVDAAAQAAGFITLDDTGTTPIPLVDFNESACP